MDPIIQLKFFLVIVKNQKKREIFHYSITDNTESLLDVELY